MGLMHSRMLGSCSPDLSRGALGGGESLLFPFLARPSGGSLVEEELVSCFICFAFPLKLQLGVPFGFCCPDAECHPLVSKILPS